MSFSAGLGIWKTSFQLCPIFLTGGTAQDIPGGMLPLIALTEALNLPAGLLSGGENIELDAFFAHFQPMAGATLIDNQIGTYPFANQSVAANAIIANPLTISMLMICPVREPFGYATKLMTMIALRETLYQHNAQGGTYTVLTPSYFFSNCIMTGMRDASNAASHQAQNTWQLDFVKPLLTLEQAQQAQNQLMGKLTNGTQIAGDPTWSGLTSGTGVTNPSITPSLIPSSTGAVGAGVADPVIPVQSAPLP